MDFIEIMNVSNQILIIDDKRPLEFSEQIHEYISAKKLKYLHCSLIEMSLSNWPLAGRLLFIRVRVSKMVPSLDYHYEMN